MARFLIVWSAAVFAYFLLAARGLIHQEYYILPAVPIASVLGGLGLAWICRLKARPYPGWEGPDAAPATTTSPTSGLYGIAAALFALTCLASTALLSLDRLAPLYAVTLPYLDTGQAVKASTLEDAAIVAVHHGQPEVLYYANRRGWQILPAEFSLARIEILRSLGADAVAVAEAVPLAGSQEMADVLRRYPALAIGPSLLVIDLNRQQGQRQLANNTAAAFGDSLQLLGYEATARPAATGKIVDITLRWKALQTIPQDLHISLRLFSAEGKLVVQSDGVPVNWFFPTTRWQTGDIVDDPYSLVVPPGNDVDRLRLELVVYDGANLRPLGVKETGQPHLDLGLVAMAGN